MTNEGITIDVLLDSSDAILQSLELARLNHAANVRKEIGKLMDELLREMVMAELARWFVDNRGELLRIVETSQTAFVFEKGVIAKLPPFGP